MSFGNLRLGFSGPGEIGKTALLKEVFLHFRKFGYKVLVVDTDLHNSISRHLEAPADLVPWSSEEGIQALKSMLTPEQTLVEIVMSYIRNLIIGVLTPILRSIGIEGLRSIVGNGPRWIELAKMESPDRIQLEDLPQELISFTDWGAVIRTYPLEGQSNAKCDHGRLNPLQTVISLLQLPERWIVLWDMPGGERTLSWGWGGLALNAVVLLYKQENGKHSNELAILQGYCQEYGLSSATVSVDGSSVRVQDGKMYIEERALRQLLHQIEDFASDEDRFRRNSQLVLR